MCCGMKSPASSPSKSSMTSMNMYFTLAYSGTPILFSSWAPKDNGAYVGAWFAIFFLAIFFRFLLWGRTVFERRWASYWYKKSMQLSTQRAAESSQGSRYPPFLMQVEFPRMFLTFITVALGYALMLITMTYVVGYFFAVCAGLASGELMLGRYCHPIQAEGKEPAIGTETAGLCCP